MSGTTLEPRTDALSGRNAASGLWNVLLWLQGIYFLVTGVWPLISLRTFYMVTGPKTDHWLVETVGVLVAVIGAVLLVAAWRKRHVVELALLAVGSAAGLTAIDVIYVVQRVILPVYLLDAAAEAILIVLWVVVWVRGGAGR